VSPRGIEVSFATPICQDSEPPIVVELHKLREVSSQQQQLAEDQRREEQGQSNRPKKKRKIQADSHPPSFDWNEAMKNLDPGQHASSVESS
jgi:transcription initiation factor TFIID subunit TAF12